MNKLQNPRSFQSIHKLALLTLNVLFFATAIEAADLSLVYSFTFPTYSGTTGQFTNSDGSGPAAPVLLISNTLYGTTSAGGTNGYGTVFRVNTNGTAFTNLHSFAAANNSGSTNEEGARPFACLVWLSNALYGTCYYGGTHALGSIFKVNADGTGFTNLYNFAGPVLSAGAPEGGMVLSSNVLYGTASLGGTGGNGAVFAINTDGTGYTNIHNFTTGNLTNSDGTFPYCDLLLVTNVLYGTASGGGSGGAGTIFRLNTDGTGFTNLHSFYANPPVGYALGNANIEGAHPQGGLVLAGNTLYGAAADGGTNGAGTLYKINTDGTGFTNLYVFTEKAKIYLTNVDGAVPYGTLAVSGNKLYGTTSQGGTRSHGTLFSINTNGTGFTVLAYLATSNSAPSAPLAGMVQSGNTFYGTGGTIFALTVTPPTPIPLNFLLSSGKFILDWNNTAFTLQSPPALDASFTDVLNVISPYTNAMSNSHMFFRLQGN